MQYTYIHQRELTMEKYYGYVYIWRDSKCNMYCIGSHYGTIEDSYITSTGWMVAAYKKRPNDFKMRVLEYLNEDDKSLLLDIEQKYLDMIKPDELGKRYYNLKKYASGGGRIIGQKNKQDHLAGGWNRGLDKEMMQLRKTGKFCILIDNPKRKAPVRRKSGWQHTEETKQKISKGLKGKRAWNKGISLTDIQRAALSASLKGRTAWNKGKSSSVSADNGKSGAKKMSKTAQGRKRHYKEDGSWTWIYNVNGEWRLTPPTNND